jgi:hypothetical protein
MAVIVGMVLAGLFGVVSCVGMVAVGDVRMVARRLMTALFMVLGGCKVVLGGGLQMFGGLPVVLCGLLGHGIFLLDLGIGLQAEPKPCR